MIVPYVKLMNQEDIIDLNDRNENKLISKTEGKLARNYSIIDYAIKAENTTTGFVIETRPRV